MRCDATEKLLLRSILVEDPPVHDSSRWRPVSGAASASQNTNMHAPTRDGMVIVAIPSPAPPHCRCPRDAGVPHLHCIGWNGWMAWYGIRIRWACRGGMVRAIIVERRPGRLPRADAAAHHGRGHGMVALFISQQAMAELTCAADPGRLLAPGTATGRPVSGLPVHDDVNATPTHLLLLLSSHRTSAILKVRLHPFFLLMNEERAG